jgi:cytochrome c oxidase subunit III
MTQPASFVPAEQFADAEKQAHAARLGMWVFLASELLLFGALFTLFAAYRVEFPSAFRASVEHNTKVLGSINTAVLLVSSTCVAGAVHALRGGRTKLSAGLVASTAVLGAIFLVIKLTEYAKHFADGIYPGGEGRFFEEHHVRGFSEFWTLYFGMTGLHAVHVTVGMTLLTVMLVGIVRGRVTPATVHRLEVAALYWHLVDIIWIFLWPLLYLA